MILETCDSTEHNSTDFCCVGTVQGNCPNFSQLGCYRPLGHEEPGRVAPPSEDESTPTNMSHCSHLSVPQTAHDSYVQSDMEYE